MEAPGRPVAKIADFGLANTLSNTSVGKTQTSAKGSGPWMSPENFDGKYSPYSDVYAFGMVIYEVITNEVPYTNMNPQQLTKAVCFDHAMPNMEVVVSGCPPLLISLMKECIVLEPTARPEFAEIMPKLDAVRGLGTRGHLPAPSAQHPASPPPPCLPPPLTPPPPHQLEATYNNGKSLTTSALVARTSHLDLSGGGDVAERLAQIEDIQQVSTYMYLLSL